MSFFEPEPPPLPLRQPDAADMRSFSTFFLPPPGIDTDDLPAKGLRRREVSALLLELALAGRITRNADGAVSLA